MKKPSNVKVGQRGQKWECRISSWRGQRYYESFDTEDEARAWERDATVRMMQGLDPQVPNLTDAKTRRKRGHTLGDLLTHTIENHWHKKGKNGQPLKSARKRIVEARKGINALGGEHTKLAGLDSQRIEAALIKAQTIDGVKPATTNRRRSALNVMFKEAEWMGWMPSAPKFRFVVENNERVFRVTPALEEAMLSWARSTQPNDDFYDWMVLALYLGQREGELIRLRLADHVAFPHDGFVDAPFAVFPPNDSTNKSNMIRTVWLRPIVEEVINRRRSMATDPTDRLLPNTVTQNWISHRWADMKNDLLDHPDVLMQRRDGLPVGRDWVPHILRHEFCSRLGDEGFTMAEIMDLAGHLSAKAAKRYIKPHRFAHRQRSRHLLAPGELPAGPVPPFAPTQPIRVVKPVAATAGAAPAIDPADAVAIVEALRAAGLGHLLNQAVSGTIIPISKDNSQGK